MAKLRETFKEVITGGKYGLFIGLAIGYAYSKWHHIDAEDAFRYIMLTHMQAGTCIGGVIGGIVKLMRMWHARRKSNTGELNIAEQAVNPISLWEKVRMKVRRQG